jgi:DNA-dependent RNA polymerase auxiliary subunit epsilon
MPKPHEDDARRSIDECARERVEHAQRIGEKGVTYEKEQNRFREIARKHDRDEERRR